MFIPAGVKQHSFAQLKTKKSQFLKNKSKNKYFIRVFILILTK